MHTYKPLALLFVMALLLMTTSTRAQIVIDADPTTPPPALEATMSYAMGAVFTVDVYLVIPGAPLPPVNAYGIAMEFNDVAGILALGGATVADPIPSGLLAAPPMIVPPVVPTDLMPPPAGGPFIAPGAPLVSPGFVPAALGPMGPFTASDGGAGIFEAAPLPFGFPAPGMILLQTVPFTATALGMSDIAPIGLFTGGPACGPPFPVAGTPPPAAVLPPVLIWPCVCELYDAATGVTICPGIVPATITVTTPLPVELVSFDARVEGNTVHFTWMTATETDNVGFELEHRTVGDGRDEDQVWPVVGFVDGHGTTLEAQHYAYAVDILTPGRHQFRLKQIDTDGTAHYSEIVETLVEVPGTHALSAAYPNPFNPQTTFSLTVAKEQPVIVTLHDVTGRLVKTLYDGIVPAQTEQQIRIDGTGLSSGLYMYQAAGTTFSESRSVLLSK